MIRSARKHPYKARDAHYEHPCKARKRKEGQYRLLKGNAVRFYQIDGENDRGGLKRGKAQYSHGFIAFAFFLSEFFQCSSPFFTAP